MFTEAQSRPVLETVCKMVSADPQKAELLRHHTNAVYALPQLQVVVKIARLGTSQLELQGVIELVNWMTSLQFPTVGLATELQQPLVVNGYLATVWQQLDSAPNDPVTASELGRLLRALHELPAPPTSIPRLEPFSHMLSSIHSSRILRPAHKDFLQERILALREEFMELSFPLKQGLIHADPQRRNALRQHNSSPVLGSV